MFKLGIIGSDNTHADAFAKMLNFPDEKTGEFLFPDFKVTSIFGLDKKRTEEVATNGKIETIVEKPEDMMGKVDAVLVVFRHGDLHMKYALPFIEAGVPTWIDKPFTVKREDAITIFKAAKKHNTLISGGSSLKHVYDVLMIKSAVENGSRIGKVRTAVINYSASLTSEYAGLFFYGPHLAEMTLKAFGYDVKSVTARENNSCVSAIIQYDRYQIIMNFFPDSLQSFCMLYGEKGIMIREIDITGCYILEFEKFAQMMRTRKPVETYEELYAPVELLNCIMESLETKKEVELRKLEI